MSLDIDTKRVFQPSLPSVPIVLEMIHRLYCNYSDAISGFCLDLYCRAFRPSYSSYLHVWVRETLGAWDVLSG
jgi:hypothetical protein